MPAGGLTSGQEVSIWRSTANRHRKPSSPQCVAGSAEPSKVDRDAESRAASKPSRSASTKLDEKAPKFLRNPHAGEPAGEGRALDAATHAETFESIDAFEGIEFEGFDRFDEIDRFEGTDTPVGSRR